MLGLSAALLPMALTLLPPLEAGLTRLAWSTKCISQRRLPMRLGRDVEVVPNSKGNGLYALRDLAEDELVGLYWGEILTDEEYQASDSSGAYAMGLANGKIMDGEDPRSSNFLRYINHSKLHANCLAVEEEFPLLSLAAVSIQTGKDIAAGSELLFDYGEEYWDTRCPRWSPKRWQIDFFP